MSAYIRMLLATFVLVSFSATAKAVDFGLSFKLGQLQLDNTSQVLADGILRNFSSDSDDTYAIAAEIRLPLGKGQIGLGMEYTRYNFTFQPISTARRARNSLLGATARYYFGSQDRAIHPYAGVGLFNRGITHVDSPTQGIITDDHFASQYFAGIEYRPKRVGFYAELKKIKNESGDKTSQDFRASGLGLFVGTGFLF